MGELTLLIGEIKEGDKDKFYLLVKNMEPLIHKYIRLLYKDEKEDIHSELVVALWEAVIKINYFENDGQIMVFLCRALKNRFFQLYKISKKQHDFEVSGNEKYINELQFIEDQYCNLITKEDTYRFLKNFTGTKKNLYCAIMVENLSDIQIASKYNMSRQYVNRVRKCLRSIFEETFIF